jgi:hypothetical protein
MYTNLGKLEEALKSFLTAKKIYHNEKAYLQEAISDSLIGILLLNYVVLNEQTYSVASKHFEHALLYFSKENILDLNWKTNFYLAELNYKYYLMKKDAKDSEQLKNKAKSYFLEMFCAVEDFEEEAPGLNSDFIPGSGITLEEAFRRAYQFFIGIGEDETAKRFTRYKN